MRWRLGLRPSGGGHWGCLQRSQTYGMGVEGKEGTTKGGAGIRRVGKRYGSGKGGEGREGKGTGVAL